MARHSNFSMVLARATLLLSIGTLSAFFLTASGWAATRPGAPKVASAKSPATPTSGLNTARSKGIGTILALENIPAGSDVTIPGPATTHVGLQSKVILGATDTPQIVSFSTVNPSGGAPVALRLAIVDNQLRKTKYVNVRPGASFLYSFRKLGSIAVVPTSLNGGNVPDSVRLQVESDKPLFIGR